MNDLSWGIDPLLVKNQEQKTKSFELISDTAPGVNNIEVFSNKIYFYDEVTKTSIFKLTKMIREVTYKMVASNPEKYFPGVKNNDYIELYIHSYGGSVMSGFAAYDVIKNNPIPIHTIIEGGVASAGTIISLAGAKRSIRETAFMLIHQLSSTNWGKFEELKDNMQNCEMLMNKIKTIYKNSSKIPNHDLEEILKHDLWLDSKKCLDWGLVDQII